MSTAEAILKAAMTPSTSRADRYMARVEDHLSGLPQSERAAFLDNELVKWEVRYRAWATRVDNGSADEADLAVTAWDFTETIGALDLRLAKLKAAA